MWVRASGGIAVRGMIRERVERARSKSVFHVRLIRKSYRIREGLRGLREIGLRLSL